MLRYLIIVLLSVPLYAQAQTLKGLVLNSDYEPLVGVSVFWLESKVGTITDSTGYFEIQKDGNSELLVAEYVGFGSDSLLIEEQTRVSFILQSVNELASITISGERSGVIISNEQTIKTERITEVELTKAACCDLAGCFETQTTVQPQVTNVITNSKELRIMGLSGVYNQVLIDGLPMIQGLTYTYGISTIPGTLVDNIYVSKGANSVLQGYESISGQINVETKEPDKTDKLLLNAYINSFGESQFNANLVIKKEKWSNLSTVHTTQPAQRIDRDKDRFLDLPLLTRYAVSNKFKFGNQNHQGLNTRIGLRFTQEQRIGGQVDFRASEDKGNDKVYGQIVDYNQPELWTKTGYRWSDRHNIVLFVSGFQQTQNSYFGTVHYQATQNNFYSNLQYEFAYDQGDLKSGISYRRLGLDETIGFSGNVLGRTYDGTYTRDEFVPGIFAENNMQVGDNLTWIVGARLDHHNQFGWIGTPRTLIKLDLSERSSIRANVGTGWRTVNLFSENINLLISSRNIVFMEDLDPERAMNYGVNYTYNYALFKEEFTGFVSLDFYRTDFQNQVFPDYLSDPTLAIIQNFTSPSVSNGFQAEALSKYESLEVKLGYRFLDVYRMIDEEKQWLPFNPRHKVMGSFSYKPSGSFHADMNIHWYGEQRLPTTESNPVGLRIPTASRPYTLVNAQITYNSGRLEMYAGCENILDFRQLRPILSWEDPFSRYFDTSSVWGPTRGREIYLGLRYRLKS